MTEIFEEIISISYSNIYYGFDIKITWKGNPQNEDVFLLYLFDQFYYHFINFVL